QNGADIPIQPCRPKVEHGSGNRYPGGQLGLLELEVGKLRRQFLLNLASERAPFRQEPSLECGVEPLHEVSSILEANSGQQRVLLSQVIENLVDDRLRHDHIQAFQRLLRVAGLHGFNQFVVIPDLFAGQDPYAAAGKDLSVTCLYKTLGLGDYRLLYRVGKLNKGLSTGALVIFLYSFPYHARKLGPVLPKQIKVFQLINHPLKCGQLTLPRNWEVSYSQSLGGPGLRLGFLVRFY